MTQKLRVSLFLASATLLPTVPRPTLSWPRHPGTGLRAPPNGPHPPAEGMQQGGRAASHQSHWGAENTPAKLILPQGQAPQASTC